MTAATPASGSAELQGSLWGARAETWAENESRQVQTYEEGIRLAQIGPGVSVLDLGCGSGVFLRVVADRGARVAGLDASEELAELSRARVPEADVRVGDLQFLPHEDDSFDVVTGFNSFQFAADVEAALREAGRVAKPGGRVLVQVWGRAERCDLTAMLGAIGPLRPSPPASFSSGPPLSTPGVLEGIASDAGLTPETTSAIRYGFEYPDEDTLLRLMLSPGGVLPAIEHAGEETVRAAIAEALTPFRREDGSYRLENEWHFMLARA